MTFLTELKNKQIAVVGMGATGFSCTRFLMSHGIAPVVMDSREKPAGLAQFEQHFPQLSPMCGEIDFDLLAKQDMVLVSPGMDINGPEFIALKEAGIELLGDVELFGRLNAKPVVAVTGSNGKSTVVTLAHHLIQSSGKKVALAGNIGTPVLDVIDDAVDGFVLELSSFQLETTETLPLKAAVYLNTSEDHMDRYSSFEEYVAAKARIYRQCDLAIYNREDSTTFPPSQIESIGLGLSSSEQGYGLNGSHITRDGSEVFGASNLKLVGRHNIFNAQAALAIAEQFDCDQPIVFGALSEFCGLPHRCETVASKQGVLWINDSKATNVGATKAAIEGLQDEFAGKIILIAGGLGKGADFSELANVFKDTLKLLICFGEDAEQIQVQFGHSVMCDSLESCVLAAQQHAVEGDLVLLSPACASQDMFNSFEHRGDVFKSLVEGLHG